MVVHKAKRLSKEARVLASNNSTKHAKKVASKYLNNHKKKKH